MEVLMRSRLLLSTLAFCLIFSFGCTSKPATDNSGNVNPNANSAPDNSASNNGADNPGLRQSSKEAPRQAIVVPARTTITVSLGSALGSKLSQSGQTFTGTIAKDVIADNVVAIPRGTAVSGTVVDAKPLGRFAGGAVLSLRIESMNVNGTDMPVQTAMRTFTAKGKGKRTAVMAGGGAALGGLIGGLAGGGKGAAIGLAAGAGAGGTGAAFTGNKDIVLPAESAVAFQLTRPLEFR
jgi:hypothetical protein